MNGQAALALNEENTLYEYGIFNEKSHFRAHVAPIAKTVFVFRTGDMIEYLNKNKCVARLATQVGVTYPTANGFLVPHNLDFIRPIYWHSMDWWSDFSEDEDTSIKGKKAVNVIALLMMAGRFPFWVIPQEVNDIKMDISGTDIIVSGKWKTQVKCDFRAGPKEKGCTGNIYIQTHERNPLKKY